MDQVKSNGLDKHVTIELRDYRDLPENIKYDRIVSVGMFEHIGVKNFPQYFGKVNILLKPVGLFLNHGITSKDGWRDTPMTRFMNQYIFPDGELARISEVSNAMENAGFELIDVENLRRHYAMTLDLWSDAFEAHVDEIREMHDEAFVRMWRLYLACCSTSFRYGNLTLWQIQFSRGLNNELPLTRDYLYR
jgi:cyclopropane-fatty-acyl-phospholipid synthase